MRKKIAAANWKMNLTLQEGELLIDGLLKSEHSLEEHQLAIFGIPFPYLTMAQQKFQNKKNVFVAAQNCSNKAKGAFTGEISLEMLKSINISYVIIGHSERREYYFESNEIIKEKVNICLSNNVTPIFCCGESLNIREANQQNDFVLNQLQESLFHLTAEQISNIVIAYEPIWAIGTGKTASTEQAQEMHLVIRKAIAEKYSHEIANNISILYGGSVKASNAVELFSQPDVDGGLVGGASLIVEEFAAIINALP